MSLLKKITFILIVIVFNLNSQTFFINQAGYSTNLPKLFYCTQQVDSFYVVNDQTGTVVFKDKVETSVSNDVSTGETIYTGDFSSLITPGKYFIRTGISDTSFHFPISDSVYKSVFEKSLKGFYFQRCGEELSTLFAGVYSHPACHLNDGTFHSTTGKSGYKENKGGWHDAGDFGKYIVNAGVTVGTLLLAYEMFPDKFASDDINIPESGNGVPDILDEVKYELNWFFKMQNDDGGVFFKLTRENFSGFVMPQNDNGTRYIYQISSTATGDFAAVMARAARLYKKYDPSFADSCLNAAVNAWKYLSNNLSIIPSGGFKNPSGTGTGEYGDGDDSDERLWASAELYETTGDNTYGDYFLLYYNQKGVFTSSMSWPNVSAFAQLTYLQGKQAGASNTAIVKLQDGLLNFSSKIHNTIESNGFRNNISPGQYIWGSNSDVLNRAIISICSFKIFNDSTYYNDALDQLNYILGCNGNDISYVTGVGPKHVMHPHHRQSAADGILEPVPGLMAGGPNQYLNDPTLQSHFNSSTPPALCYIDNQESYASNEIAINWNAPLVFVAGFFAREGMLSSVDKFGSLVPGSIEVEQNYPNPFNGTTMISYKLSIQQNIRFRLFNVLGNLLLDENLGLRSPGIYNYYFDGKNEKGESLVSGIYLYQIHGNNFSAVKKMILLK